MRTTSRPEVIKTNFSARLNHGMNTDGSSKESPNRYGGGDSGDGLVVLSYVLAGLIFYGGLGWLGDHFLNTRILLPLGLALGLALSIYMIIKRYGSTT